MHRAALLIAAWLAAGTAWAAPQARASRPNIVILLADDLGYRDTGLYGSRDIPTPHIDSIARRGAVFTSGYVTAAVCSPSRAGLLTGRYQQRFGFEFNAGPAERAFDPEIGLPLGELTLADVLKRSGYATGIVGKWHLGADPSLHPRRRGFDEFFGFVGGDHRYVDPDRPGVSSFRDVRLADSNHPRNPIYRNETPVEEKEYLTDAFAREAVAFIDRHKTEPFFLYAAFNAPHTPYQATKTYFDRFPQIADERRRIYSAMVSGLDTGVGTILGRLRELGLERDTLVFFLSDNGCATYAAACTNEPLRLGKMTYLEGGIRVPFALQWPSRVKPGVRYDHPVISLDVFATAVAAAGVTAPQNLDGVDLVPHLSGVKKSAPHDLLFWRAGENSALRSGRWKLFRAGDHTFLFDLASDLGELTNQAAAKPDAAERLLGRLRRWESEMRDPRWTCQSGPHVWEVDGVRLKVCY